MPCRPLNISESEYVAKVEVQACITSSGPILAETNIHTHDKGLEMESQPYYMIHGPITETDVSR